MLSQVQYCQLKVYMQKLKGPLPPTLVGPAHAHVSALEFIRAFQDWAVVLKRSASESLYQRIYISIAGWDRNT